MSDKFGLDLGERRESLYEGNFWDPDAGFYSLIYKPFVLLYSALCLLLQSGALGLECVTSLFGTFVNWLPSLVDDESQREVSEPIKATTECVVTFVAAISLVTVAIFFDMVSSVLSLVGRSVMSLAHSIDDYY